MDKDEALKLALEALEANFATWSAKTKAIPIIKEALAQSDDLTIAYMAGLYDGKNKDAPQREWQSLTDEEIEAIGKDDKVLLAQFHTSVKAIDEMKDPTAQIMNLVIRQQGLNFAKAIEAKLKEKNSKQITAEELAKLFSEHHQLTQENYLLKGQVETLMEEWKKSNG